MKPMKPFPFMELPIELRRMVYKHAFDSHYTLPAKGERRATTVDRLSHSHTVMALLWTSRQIHEEMTVILHDIPRIFIELHTRQDLLALDRWLQPVRLLGDVVIDGFGMDAEDLKGYDLPYYHSKKSCRSPKLFVTEKDGSKIDEVILVFGRFNWSDRMSVVRNYENGKSFRKEGKRIRGLRYPEMGLVPLLMDRRKSSPYW